MRMPASLIENAYVNARRTRWPAAGASSSAEDAVATAVACPSSLVVPNPTPLQPVIGLLARELRRAASPVSRASGRAVRGAPLGERSRPLAERLRDPQRRAPVVVGG